MKLLRLSYYIQIIQEYKDLLLIPEEKIFADINLRKAITNVFDFEWSNNKLFYNQYLRSDSYFSNSRNEKSNIELSDEEYQLAKDLGINA